MLGAGRTLASFASGPTHHRKPLDAKQKVLVMFEIRLTDNADWSDRDADRSD